MKICVYLKQTISVSDSDSIYVFRDSLKKCCCHHTGYIFRRHVKIAQIQLLNKKQKMKFASIASLFIIFLAVNVQSMDVRNHDGISMFEFRNNLRKSNQQAVSSFKAALRKLSKCFKLKAKMMIKYRNRPRLARRIAKLTLEC